MTPHGWGRSFQRAGGSHHVATPEAAAAHTLCCTPPGSALGGCRQWPSRLQRLMATSQTPILSSHVSPARLVQLSCIQRAVRPKQAAPGALSWAASYPQGGYLFHPPN